VTYATLTRAIVHTLFPHPSKPAPVLHHILPFLLRKKKDQKKRREEELVYPANSSTLTVLSA
jgi:hypothetical protein